MNLEPTLSLRLLLPQNVHVPIIGTMTLTDFAIRVGLALLLGSLIGAEREWRHKLAGLKTNALVCVGSALFTCIGYQASSMGHADPTRIAGQIASGIGFLGAGAILRDGLTIRGLTTAATVWCAAAIGSLAGAGMLVHAVVGTGFIFGCNFALKEMAGMLFKHHNVDAPVHKPSRSGSAKKDCGVLRRQRSQYPSLQHRTHRYRFSLGSHGPMHIFAHGPPQHRRACNRFLDHL